MPAGSVLVVLRLLRVVVTFRLRPFQVTAATFDQRTVAGPRTRSASATGGWLTFGAARELVVRR